MLYFIHALVGSVIGSHLNSIPAIIFLAFISHFLLDMIPHWDNYYDKLMFERAGHLEVNKRMVIMALVDVAIAVFFVIYIIITSKAIYNWHLIFIGAFFAVLPDILSAGYFTPLRKNKYYMGYLKFHSRIQTEVMWQIGMLTQFIILIAVLAIFHVF